MLSWIDFYFHWNGILSFPYLLKKNLASQLSDHRPIVLDTGDGNQRYYISRFEKVWQAEGVRELVEQVWQRNRVKGSAAKRMTGKLRTVRQAIKE